MVRPGRLNRRLQLQRPARTRGAAGGYTTSWTTVATVWGAIEPLRGGEAREAAQVSTEIVGKAIIRKAPEWAALDDTWRIVDEATGRKYGIVQPFEPEFSTLRDPYIEMQVIRGKIDDE